MPNTLQGANISNTYQRVVQVENGQLSDGTGSALPISFNGNDVTILGALHATSISSSRVTSSVIYTSGSSTFGDQASDTHTFLGHVTTSGNISASGDMVASNFNIKHAGSIVNETYPTTTKMQFGGNIIYFYAGSTSNPALIMASNQGVIINENSSQFIDFRVESNTDTHALFVDSSLNSIELGRATTTHVTASGNISASGNLISAKVNINGGNDASLSDGTGYLVIGDEQSTNIVFDNNEIQSRNNEEYSTLHLQAEGGDIIFHYNEGGRFDISHEGHVTASGNISASSTSYIQAPELRGHGSTTQLHVQGQITASSNISASGNVYANQYWIQGENVAGINAGEIVLSDASLGTQVEGSHIHLDANVTASGNISASGKVYSDNEEILWNGSGRGGSLSTDEYASPGQHGVNYTVWSQQGDDQGGAGIAVGNGNMGGIHIPYSCSLVGVVGNINSQVTGNYTIALWHKKLLDGMASSAFGSGDLLFETANINQAATNKSYLFRDVSGANSTFIAASGSALHYPSVIIPSIHNVDAVSGNVVAHFGIIIKRWPK